MGKSTLEISVPFLSDFLNIAKVFGVTVEGSEHSVGTVVLAISGECVPDSNRCECTITRDLCGLEIDFSCIESMTDG